MKKQKDIDRSHIETLLMFNYQPHWIDKVVAIGKAQQLLKAERARVRRLVREVKAQYRGSSAHAVASYHQACDDILATLKEGR